MVTGYGLLIVFAIAIAILLFSIIKMKVNPFLALLSSSVITGFLVRMPLADISTNISAGFGNTLKGIGIVIGLGIIFGNILSEARATEAIAKGLIKKTGEKNSALAINASGFLISIPVFMDAAFVIMMPLVKYVSKMTKKPMMVYITALGVGTIIGHALVIPTPGPLAVAANVNANIGAFIFYSLIVGFPAAMAGGYYYGKYLEKHTTYVEIDDPAMPDVDLKSSTNVPSFGLSMIVLLFPILMILAGNIFGMVVPADSTAKAVLSFIGDKNIALLVGVIVAMLSMKNYLSKSFDKIIIESADSAGLILLITGAGGAFGSVINASGIGAYLVETMTGLNISLLILAFFFSAILRIAQGSTTVALVTTSSILGPTIAATGLSPVLIGLAICAGGAGFSLPNDSGFWVLSRFGGLSVKDTLKSWTAGGTIAAVTAFVIVLILSAVNNVVGLPGL